MKFKHSAMAVIAGVMASIIAPPESMPPAVWASRNLVVPDGPRAGKLWSPELTPYIVEPLNAIGPDQPDNEVAVMKAAQTGFTMMAIAAAGHSIDCDPCRMGVMQPTSGALTDFIRDKLQPAIIHSETLADKVEPQTSRSGEGSTIFSKMFPGGSLSLMLASSAADLRSKTLKKLFRDEIDQYEDDLDKQGDPLDLSRARLQSFLAQGDWKILDISTPTIKGASKIERRYMAGDQRRWHVPCPHCSTAEKPSFFVFEFGDHFIYNREFPYKAHYVTPCCEEIIYPEERDELVRRGTWVATAPRPGAFKSYHFDTLSSPFVPWDEVAKKIIEAGDDPRKLQAFWNLDLGLPYEVKGDAPDHVRLMERRQPGYRRGHIPSRGLILTATADVQGNGIWFEVRAVGPDRQTWVVDADFLDGATDSPTGSAFEKLKERVLLHHYPDAFERTRRIDALGVDAGFRSHVVYAWVRNNQAIHPDTGRDMVLALDGRHGWGKPAIGAPTIVDINLDGQKIRKGAKLWPVGTWPLKGAFFADLAKVSVGTPPTYPEGYCHFADWLDENYFRQITSEYLAEETHNGIRRRIWKPIPSQRDNHLLDCRVYNMALAEYLGLSSTTPDEWAELARRRGMPEEAIAKDLFAPRPALVDAAGQPVASPAPAPKPTVADAFARLAALNAG